MSNLSVRREPTWRGAGAILFNEAQGGFDTWKYVNVSEFTGSLTGAAVPAGARITKASIENPTDYALTVKFFTVEDPTAAQLEDGVGEFIGAKGSKEVDLYPLGGVDGIKSVAISLTPMPGYPEDAADVFVPQSAILYVFGWFFVGGQLSE